MKLLLENRKRWSFVEKEGQAGFCHTAAHMLAQIKTPDMVVAGAKEEESRTISPRCPAAH